MKFEYINGYIHTTEDDAFIATVQIVSKRTAEHRSGVEVGIMALTDGSDIRVFRHPAGTYYGYEFSL